MRSPRFADPFPLDRGNLRFVRKTGKLIVAHEAVLETCGVGAMAQSVVEGAFDYLEAPVVRVAAKDLPIPVGVLQDEVFPNSADVEKAIKKVME